MIHSQEVAEFLAGQWQSLSAAPITFLVAVMGGSAVTGLVFGLLISQFQSRTAQSELADLGERKRSEDDLLGHVGAEHDLEVEAR